jgi:hypothetical protein
MDRIDEFEEITTSDYTGRRTEKKWLLGLRS